ncbi:conserved hypothetical protein [Ricinus communis]|uniref:At2g29880-like C-terminal domain-containing protein n=1 Tax=Ricinus communis TaxID=3988 RepID=B9RVN7_RICCO|nr:conserved hypothetical protein [Ricinus communis]
MQDSLYQSPSYRYSTLPLPFDIINLDVPKGRKRGNRSEFEGKTTSFESNNNQANIESKLTHFVDKLVEAIKSFDSSEHSCWDIIKEKPNLDKRACLKAFKLLNTRAKKIEFLKMTPKKRYKWITYELEQ